VAATCCRIMRIDPLRIHYLQLASESDAQLLESNIHQAGESIESVATKFRLIPEFERAHLETV
jgi:hypothetical protein